MRRTLFTALVLLGLFFVSGAAPAAAQTRTFETGSLIIPMDLSYQDRGLFQAYGLVFQLLRQEVTVYWVIDPDTQATCSAPTSNAKDALLHEIACLWHAMKVFAIILTPNYNADHRNHFHVDLTSGANYIGAISADAVGVDPPAAAPAH